MLCLWSSQQSYKTIVINCELLLDAQLLYSVFTYHFFLGEIVLSLCHTTNTSLKLQISILEGVNVFNSVASKMAFIAL